MASTQLQGLRAKLSVHIAPPKGSRARRTGRAGRKGTGQALEKQDYKTFEANCDAPRGVARQRGGSCSKV